MEAVRTEFDGNVATYNINKRGREHMNERKEKASNRSKKTLI